MMMWTHTGHFSGGGGDFPIYLTPYALNLFKEL